MGIVNVIVKLCCVCLCFWCPTRLLFAEDTFQALQNEFMEEHYHHFEDVEENKLVYTDIFTKYVRLDV